MILYHRKGVLQFSFVLLITSYSLLLCGLFNEAICFKSCLVLFCSSFINPLSIATTSLGEEKANLSAFRMFV